MAEEKVKVTLELTIAQIAALGMIMGYASEVLDKQEGVTKGIWKHLKGVNEQLRAQFKHNHR